MSPSKIAAVVLLAVFCFTQAVHSKTTLGVIAEYCPILKQLSRNVSVAANETGIKIAASVSSMESSRNASWIPVAIRLQKLENVTQRAIIEAESKGKNITRCLKNQEKALSKLDLNAVNKCNPEESVANATQSVKNLRNLQKKASKISMACLLKCPLIWQGEEIKKCLDEAIADVQTLLDKELSSAAAVLKDATKVNGKCAKSASQILTKGVNYATRNFQLCVKRARIV